ncbi:hypothetical protein PIB30_054469 [Stylosanthes scabra]|uniref:Reverse transcriptase zinc-binding domain-containing protein n=1 Tax=Stylosanthes scabra TaxID=79078 RepID=A0ABU6WIP4_9FABA|nr:hypothetical protein [Stylosanthes scabra]
MKHVFGNVRCGLIPPRIEMLAWFIISGGLNTKDILLKRGVIRQGEEACVLCGEEIESTNHLVDEWLIARYRRRTKRNQVTIRDEVKNPHWWQCYHYKERENLFVVGGYYTDETGTIKVWMGEEIEGISQGDAYIQGLESVVQFLLEDLKERNENTIMVSCRKDIANWLKGSN